MYYNTSDWYDDKINFILNVLFNTTSRSFPAITIKRALSYLNELDIAATYLLFSLVCEHLPYRAKMVFAGEDYQGKRQTLIEVMQQRQLN